MQYKELVAQPDGEPSRVVAARVAKARERQQRRFAGEALVCNAQMGPRQVARHCALGEEAARELEQAIESMGFSARAYDRILKVSRTIADLAASESIQADHVAEAIQYWSLDRTYWNTY